MFKQHHLEDYEVPETEDLATLSDQFFKELQNINEKKNSKGKLLWVICEHHLEEWVSTPCCK